MAGVLCPGLDNLQTTHQALRRHVTNNRRMLGFDFLDGFQQHRLKARRVADEVVINETANTRHRGAAAEGVAGVSAGHGAGRVGVHNFGFADDARKRQRAGHAFANADEVGRHAVMLKCPHRARAPKARLNFVED